MSGAFEELAVPAPPDAKAPFEMARIWIEGSQSFIALNFGLFEEDDELRLWGCLAADVIAHVVRAHLLDGRSGTPEDALAAVEAGLRERLADNPTMRGQFANRSLS